MSPARRTRTPRRARAASAGRPDDELRALLPRMKGRRILVHADLVADEFVMTGSPRVSREAPVLILAYLESRIVPGGGANAAANVAALGGVPVTCGEVGADEVGRELVSLLEEAGADCSGILVNEAAQTPRKTRILAGDKHVVPQQVVRIDRIEPALHDTAFQLDLKARLVKILPRVEGVLVSDYGLGFVDPESVEALVLHSPHRKRLKVALDSRHRLFEYPGVDVATPSEPEVEAALDRALTSPKSVEQAGRDTLARLRAEALVITRGSRGMIVFEDGEPSLAIDAFGSGAVTDVTGAGDTVIATLSLALAAGASYAQAARLANVAAGISVTKRGTATVSPEEIEAALTGSR